jgi:uncharacterized membrane protein YraQ (UPF0718 family)
VGLLSASGLPPSPSRPLAVHGRGAPVDDPGPAATPISVTRGDRSRRLIWVGVVIVLLGPGSFDTLFGSPAVRNWSTVFISVTLQALPFLVLGVVVSAVISALIPGRWLAQAIPQRTALAVPVAGLAGAVLPGCECSSVPVAARLMDRGVPQASALTFLLAAPSINPVVLAATAVAFPGRPEMVVARLLASLTVAVVVGLVWSRLGNPGWMRPRRAPACHTSRANSFVATAATDFLQAGGFLVAGAALVATFQTAVPQRVVDSVAGSDLTALLALSALAVVLSICSEADAFVAAGLPQFSLTARLAFLVIGPMVDLKLIALQTGTFGRRFAARFAPLTFFAALATSVLVGSLLL